MSLSLVFALVVAVGAVAFFFGRQRAASQDNGAVKAHSRPHYHGWWAFLLATLPAVLLIIVWAIGLRSMSTATSMRWSRIRRAMPPPATAFRSA